MNTKNQLFTVENDILHIKSLPCMSSLFLSAQNGHLWSHDLGKREQLSILHTLEEEIFARL